MYAFSRKSEIIKTVSAKLWHLYICLSLTLFDITSSKSLSVPNDTLNDVKNQVCVKYLLKILMFFGKMH